MLVNSSGRTLYRFTPDRRHVSTCKGACAKFWPPLLIKSSLKPEAGAGVKAALLGTMKHSRGLLQITYAGFPLYLFAEDSKAGQVKGEGFQNTWFVVSATRGALVKNAVAVSTGATSGSGASSGGGSSSGGSGGNSRGGGAWG